jgi:hypothetical protein
VPTRPKNSEKRGDKLKEREKDRWDVLVLPDTVYKLLDGCWLVGRLDGWTDGRTDGWLAGNLFG